MQNPLLVLFFLACIACADMAKACDLQQGSSIPQLRIASRSANPGESYIYQLLNLALQKTRKDFGPCEAKLIEATIPRSRVQLKLNRGEEYDVIPLTVSRERDTSLLPVPFPVYRGLMGYRILVVRSNSSPDFSQVNSAADLADFSYGVGETWVDNHVLSFNGLNTVKGLNTAALYEMLKLKRFDALIRGSHEVISDKKRVSHENTSAEEKLVIAYPLPVNFYVRRGNTGLANRLHTGFERAYNDGSIDTHFDNNPLVKQTIEEMHLLKRKFIYLCNPTLLRDAAIDSDKYWLIPWPKEIKDCQNKFIASLTPPSIK
ncbi:hypothetical protein SAMN02745866_03135 [Alteromonadaceae bacterium Bs31]|nr:hypothetical protein SAMN02745866_03135 [Alteromonadaceae bacterium Bs31]